MKGWIVSLCLFVLLLFMIAGNAIYVRHVAEHISGEAQTLSLESENAEQTLSSLEEYWKKHRPYVALSIGYRELDHLSESLISLRAAYDEKSKSDFALYRRLSIDAAEELARLEQFSVENLF